MSGVTPPGQRGPGNSNWLTTKTAELPNSIPGSDWASQPGQSLHNCRRDKLRSVSFCSKNNHFEWFAYHFCCLKLKSRIPRKVVQKSGEKQLLECIQLNYLKVFLLFNPQMACLFHNLISEKHPDYLRTFNDHLLCVDIIFIQSRYAVYGERLRRLLFIISGVE